MTRHNLDFEVARNVARQESGEPGGLTAGPDGEPTIDIHGGDRPAAHRPPKGPDEGDAGTR